MEVHKYRISVSINASQDFSLRMTLIIGSAYHACQSASVAIIPLIAQNVLRVTSCSSILPLSQQLILALTSVQMATMLMQRTSAKDALITARHASTTILAKFATLDHIK